MSIRLSKCSLGETERKNVLSVLDNEYLGMGREVKLFEEEVKRFLQTDHEVISCNTGTSALHLSLLALDIGPGDEVLVPSITFVASYQAISATGAHPVSCDILPDCGFIDVDDAKKRLTKKTKAIMSVHYASDASRQEDVNSFATKHGLRVIEDAAHSFGSRTQSGMVGQSGDIICFSFDGIKNITCGEGGAILTKDPLVVERVKDARLLGVEKDTDKRFSGSRSWDFDVRRQGFRYHMSNIMAAIGLGQMKQVDRLLDQRRKNMFSYIDELKALNEVVILDLDFDKLTPHIFVIKVPNQRDQLRTYLEKRGIETGIHYFPNHLLSKYKTSYSLSKAENWHKEALTLPIHPDLSIEDTHHVVSSIKAFFT